jgi:hypothetical protein
MAPEAVRAHLKGGWPHLDYLRDELEGHRGGEGIPVLPRPC